MASRRALLSVSDKRGLVPLARGLLDRGWELLASGGTGRALAAAGLAYTPVESVTRNAEAFDGRMKTISFEIESAILFDRYNAAHAGQAQRLGVIPIDLVACNFYSFAGDVEEIDVGGPTMVRAAAKNFASVVVLTDPAQYEPVLAEMAGDGLPGLETRRRLAAAAFRALLADTAAVSAWLDGGTDRTLALADGQPLRYGENPHQEGRVFALPGNDPLALRRFALLQGKPMSYNNYLDADAALLTVALLGGDAPAAVVVKHANPCGAARADTLAEAFQRAWDGDPVAAFGGIVACNRPVDAAAADALLADKRFFEILLAPELSAEARERFAARKNLRVLVNPALAAPTVADAWEYRSIRGGMLAQTSDAHALGALEYVTERRPTPEQEADLRLAWQICRASKSNAVTLARGGMLVGNGVGQPDRVGSCRLAVEKAGDRAAGAVAASDAFFPFPDGPEVLARAGVAAILQPGGSVRDADTVALCNRMGVAMATTGGVRCFRH